MASRDERIANLASTLKSSGVEKSDSQARMMAEEMIGVEENVQRRFDEEHKRAQDFLMTAKNLGTAGTIKKSAEKAADKPKLEPLYTEKKPEAKPEYKPVDIEIHEKHVKLDEVPVKHDFGNKSLKDLMMGQIEEDHHDIKNIEELKEEIVLPNDEGVMPIQDFQEPDVSEDKPSEQKESGVEVQIDENAEPVYGDDIVQEHPIEDQPDMVNSVQQADQPKLDTNKLVEMMEEDGKMEEHTREIKEKPKNVKPKEEYEENNIDLSSMFNVNK
jgi:hypothetical protein